MTAKQSTLSDNNYGPIKQGLGILPKDFGIEPNVGKTKKTQTE
jgi:hypothetical protein